MYLEIITADQFGVELLFVRWILVGTLNFEISASVEASVVYSRYGV